MSRTVESLIDEAAKACGGQAKLAKRIGVSGPRVSAWKSGAEVVTAEAVGLLCDVLELDGDEARRLAAMAVVARAKPARKEALRRAFFVSLALGAVVLWTTSSGTSDEVPLSGSLTSLTAYTSCTIMKPQQRG